MTSDGCTGSSGPVRIETVTVTYPARQATGQRGRIHRGDSLTHPRRRRLDGTPLAIKHGPRYHVPHALICARPHRFLAQLPAMLFRDHGVEGMEQVELSYQTTPDGDRLVAWEAFYGRDAGGILRQSILSFGGVRIHQAGIRAHHSHHTATLLGDTDLPGDCADYCVSYTHHHQQGEPGRVRWEAGPRVDLRFALEDLEAA